MSDEKQHTDFASTMFKKGSNTVELVFTEQFGFKPNRLGLLKICHNDILNVMLYCYLLGALSYINDNASFFELSEALDMVYNKETANTENNAVLD